MLGHDRAADDASPVVVVRPVSRGLVDGCLLGMAPPSVGAVTMRRLHEISVVESTEGSSLCLSITGDVGELNAS
jgi:hypothetical protein